MRGSGVKIVYITHAGNEEPWYSDFAMALGDRFPHIVLDPDAPLAPQFEGARVVVDQGGHGTRAMIDAGAEAGVELWQVVTTGVDHCEVAHILERGIRLANIPGLSTAVALAEHVLFLMLFIAKNFRASDRNLRAGIMYKPFNDELAKWGVERCDEPQELDRLLRESDYVSIHIPLTATTRHLVNAEKLELMKPSCVLINVARGEIVDESALVAALTAGRLRAAGVDVFSQEPPGVSSPLLQLPNVVATPHVAGTTYGTSKRRGEMCVQNVIRVADGLAPLHEVTSAA
jgi:phosphoglycerate dehydrogenase-like enzyme